MRLLFVLIALMVPLAAQAQTSVPKETANSYFDNCVKTASPQQGLSVQAQEMLCACTAARLTQFFSMEDWKTMTGPNPAEARIAYNKMLINVYAPCMEEPTRERYYGRCAKTQGMDQKICTCASDKIAAHMAVQGPDIFTRLLAKDPNMQDPWAGLEEDAGFNNFIDTATRSCLPQ